MYWIICFFITLGILLVVHWICTRNHIDDVEDRLNRRLLELKAYVDGLDNLNRHRLNNLEPLVMRLKKELEDMTNKDFYGDKLLAVALENACRKLRKAVYDESCVEKSCYDCEFYTVENIENWLNAEHKEPEPPLLENGDDLKPGDWIMVRDLDGDSWVKRQFMCYYRGKFVCVREGHSIDEHADFFRWSQARLPMEGE